MCGRDRHLHDQFILDAISHCHIDFETKPFDNTTSMVRRQCNFTHAEQAIINVEINKLLKKGIIKPSKQESIQFISPISLLRLKKMIRIGLFLI